MMILAFEVVETRLAPKATIAEVEKLALELPETERVWLSRKSVAWSGLGF